MDRPVDLIPLVCPQCSTRIPAGIDEVAWTCTQCGLGLLLDESKGLATVEFHYASSILPNAVGKPYWVAQGEVTLTRESYDWGSQQGKEAADFWSTPRRFYVPAYQTSLEDLLGKSVQLLLAPPPLQAGSPTRFESIVLPPESVLPTAEFIVMAVEAGRKDKLKKLDFQLKLAPRELWVLPS